MTDYNLVRSRMLNDFHYSEEELDGYSSFLNHAIAGVHSIIKDDKYSDDTRIVNLCAIKAHYQIILTSEAQDDISSFKAGDISYTRDASGASRVKSLLDSAMHDCSDLVVSGRFSFKAV